MKAIVLILAIILAASHISTAQYGNDALLDSLAAIYYSLDDNDTNKLQICNEISSQHYNVDSTFAWADRLIKLSKIHQDAYYEAQALMYLSWAHYYRDEYTEANKCNFRAIIIGDSIRNQSIIARNYLMLGDNFSYLNNYRQSTQYYKIALQMFEELEEQNMIAACYRAMAQTFFQQKLYPQAEEYLQKAIVIDSTKRDNDYLLIDYQSLAQTYLTKYLYNNADKDTSLIDIAKQIINKTDSIETDYEYGIYSALDTKANILYYEACLHGYQGQRLQSLLDTMRTCYEVGTTIINRQKNSDSLCFIICKANYYTLSQQYDSAKKIIDTLLYALNNTETTQNSKDWIYLACDNYYTATNDYPKAYYYKSKFYESINSQTSIDYAVMVTEDIAQAKFDEQINERQEEELKRTKKIFYTVAILMLILLIVIIEIIRSRRHNRALNEKNEKISVQNQRIKASIHYASLIQHAAMPSEAELRRLFADTYIIYRPLHIVAGDFYWVNQAGK
ncbi:MAG: tetratricopeptide repeat protein, partial [Bacteroidales bacterium]|nr:tetratricopeptide repeat protein [Bacteroidales bacterium]